MIRGRSHRGLGALLSAVAILCGCAASASAAPITEFTGGGLNTPRSLTAGPDGDVWFVDVGAIGRITPQGQITEFTMGLNPGSNPNAIVAGSDGNLWFTDPATGAIGKITPKGTITETSVGLNAGSNPFDLTAGANGTLWFTDTGTQSAIGRITPASGEIKEFNNNTDPVPSLEAITEGSDGNVYFTDKGNQPGVGKVTPTGTITETPDTDKPFAITSGPDGNVWYVDPNVPSISRLTPGGTLTPFSGGLQMNSAPDDITTGSDGNLWFDDQLSGSNAIGRITPAGVITEFKTQGTPGGPSLGIDGNIWTVQANPSAILRVVPAGTISTFTSGIFSTADLLDVDSTEGPDGNLWFVDHGPPGAIGRADVQLAPTAKTGAAGSVTKTSATAGGTVNPRGATTTVSVQWGTTSGKLDHSVGAGTLQASPNASPVSAGLTGLPAGTRIFFRVAASNAYGTATGATASITTPGGSGLGPTGGQGNTTRTITATLGNQRISLVTPLPTACTAHAKRLSFSLSSASIPHSKATRLRFRGALVYLDRGVRHRRVRHVHGHQRTIVFYTANAKVHKLPAHPSLRVTKLRSGRHTLRLNLSFAKLSGAKLLHKTMSSRFRVC